MLSKSLQLLKDALLQDWESEGTAKIIYVEGAEAGHDYLSIYTQTREQKEGGIATFHRIESEEVDIAEVPCKFVQKKSADV